MKKIIFLMIIGALLLFAPEYIIAEIAVTKVCAYALLGVAAILLLVKWHRLYRRVSKELNTPNGPVVSMASFAAFVLYGVCKWSVIGVAAFILVGLTWPFWKVVLAVLFAILVLLLVIMVIGMVLNPSFMDKNNMDKLEMYPSQT